MRVTVLILCLVFFVAVSIGVSLDGILQAAQTNAAQLPDDDPTLRDFDPHPALKVPATDLKKAKFPVIDIHSHFGIRLKGDPAALKDYVRVMDENNIAISVSLDAKLGDEEDHLQFLGQQQEQRLVAFVNIDFQGPGEKENPATWSWHNRPTS